MNTNDITLYLNNYNFWLGEKLINITCKFQIYYLVYNASTNGQMNIVGRLSGFRCTFVRNPKNGVRHFSRIYTP